MPLDILIVDDEDDIRSLVADILSDEGYIPRNASNSTESFEEISKKAPSAIILDIWLKDSELDGLGVLEVVKRKYPDIPVIVISGHGNIETAVTSLRLGAYDYIEKPFKQDKLLHTIKRAIETAHLKTENKKLKQVASQHLLIGNSPSITQVRQSIDRVSPTGSRVFISGPAGSGKETIAHIIHNKSHRCNEPFITLNASSLSSGSVDHFLFGTEDSRDLNAPPRKIGVFEQVANGTLFIDEITDIPLESQGKFVRFLQDKSFERVGGNRRVDADVRVISATNKNMQKEIAAGRFREDLFYRLNVVPLKAPSLKERKEDIPLICDFFLANAAKISNLPIRKMSDSAITAMQVYDWPGNVRQLRNVMEWILIMHQDIEDNIITSEMLPHELFAETPIIAPEVNFDIMTLKLRDAREMFERQYIQAQINRFSGNISRTAVFIGMERSALHRKLKSLNIKSEEKVA